MHAAVADDAVGGTEQRREDADVGVIARAIEDDVGDLEEAAQPLLELLVDRQRCDDRPTPYLCTASIAACCSCGSTDSPRKSCVV